MSSVPAPEARMRAESLLGTFRIVELKNVLRRTGGTLSGNKPELLQRIRAMLTDPRCEHRLITTIVDVQRERELSGNGGVGGASFMRSIQQQQQVQRPSYRLLRWPNLRIHSTLLKPVSLEAGTKDYSFHRGQSKTFTFAIDPTSHTKLTEHGSRARIFLRCCKKPKDVKKRTCYDTFPRNIQLRVNGNLMPNISTRCRPLDITTQCRDTATGFMKPKSSLLVSETMIATPFRDFFIGVFVADYLSPEELAAATETTSIENGKAWIMQKLKKEAEDSDIVSTKIIVTLCCPLSRVRMKVPCRPKCCTHIEGFDLISFLKMMERKPAFNCPVCTKSIHLEDLCVDGFFKDILEVTGSSVKEVQLFPNGTWSKHDTQEPDTDDNDDDSDDDMPLQPTQPSMNGRNGFPPLNLFDRQQRGVPQDNDIDAILGRALSILEDNDSRRLADAPTSLPSMTTPSIPQPFTQASVVAPDIDHLLDVDHFAGLDFMFDNTTSNAAGNRNVDPLDMMNGLVGEVAPPTLDGVGVGDVATPTLSGVGIDDVAPATLSGVGIGDMAPPSLTEAVGVGSVVGSDITGGARKRQKTMSNGHDTLVNGLQCGISVATPQPPVIPLTSSTTSLGFEGDADNPILL